MEVSEELKEIWREIIYTRIILSRIVESSSELHLIIDKRFLKEASDQALAMVEKKFEQKENKEKENE